MPDAHELLNDAAEMMRNILTAFCDWSANNWPLDYDKIKNEKPPLSQDYVDGWNACAASLDQAVKCWLEELP